MENLLKSLNLDNEILNKILNKYNSDLENINNSKNELEKKLEFSQSEIKTRDNQLKELSKIDIDDLKSKIKLFEEENKELIEKHSSEIRSLKIDSAIEKALILNNAKNIKMGKALLDLNKIQIDEKGNITGLDEQIKNILKDDSTSFLFDKKEISLTGAKPVEYADKEVKISVDPNKMSYEEFLNNYGGN